MRRIRKDDRAEVPAPDTRDLDHAHVPETTEGLRRPLADGSEVAREYFGRGENCRWS